MWQDDAVRKPPAALSRLPQMKSQSRSANSRGAWGATAARFQNGSITRLGRSEGLDRSTSPRCVAGSPNTLTVHRHRRQIRTMRMNHRTRSMRSSSRRTSSSVCERRNCSKSNWPLRPRISCRETRSAARPRRSYRIFERSSWRCRAGACASLSLRGNSPAMTNPPAKSCCSGTLIKP